MFVCEICENFRNIYLEEYLQKATSKVSSKNFRPKIQKQPPGPNTGCFSRRWPLLGARKSAVFFQDMLYSLKAHAHYFTVLIYLVTWRAAKLGIFTHFTFTNLLRCSQSIISLIYVYYIQISSRFLWVLDHSRDRTSS